MKTMRVVLPALLLFALCGCGWFSGTGKSKTQGERTEEQSKEQAQAQVMEHEVKVSFPASPGVMGTTTIPIRSVAVTPPELPDEPRKPIVIPVLLKVDSVGVTASVPPGADLTVTSKTDTESKTKSQAATREKTQTETEKKSGLPWGVYVAVIVLVAGGVFVSFRFGPGWGIPLVIGGVLVYGVFEAFHSNPEIVAAFIGIAALVCALGYIVHLYLHTATVDDAATKADVISQFKTALNSASDAVRSEMKEALKKVLGDSSNPTRQTFDAEIKKA